MSLRVGEAENDSGKTKKNGSRFGSERTPPDARAEIPRLLATPPTFHPTAADRFAALFTAHSR